MTPIQEKALKNVKKWLEEYKIFQFNEIEDEDNAFTIVVLQKSNLKEQPIYVMGHKNQENIILIAWVLRLDDQTKESVKIINLQIKRKFEVAMKTVLQINNIDFDIYDNLEDMKTMYAQKALYFSKLSKEKLYDQICDLEFSMKLVEKKFVEFFSVPIQFDPSSHV